MKAIPDTEKTAEDWASLPDVVVLHIGIVNALVCARSYVTNEEIERVVNREHMTGISSSWSIDEDVKPVACKDGRPDATHYVLSC